MPEYFLLQARDPGGRSPNSLLAVLARSDTSPLLGARSCLARLLHRIAPDASVPRGQEHTASTGQTRHPIRRGGGPAKEGSNTPVSPDQERSGFYSTYFLVLKRDGGHRPILNLKFFNFIAVMRPHHWMASVDLKDAYFHIGVVPVHFQYLRFRWLGQSYQFGALPFKLSRPWPHWRLGSG